MADIIEAVLHGLLVLLVAAFGPFAIYGVFNPEFLPVFGEFLFNLFQIK